ncbi:MAG: heparinase II/III family protein [Pseudomonadota bacterium]
MQKNTSTTLINLAALAARRAGVITLEQAGAALWQRQLSGTPSRILFAPETLLTSDPGAAENIYAGVFALAGDTVDVAGDSPFSIVPPTARWARALHSFEWLIHLEAHAGELSAVNARALIEEWIAAKSASSSAAQAPDVVARRVTAWLVESPLLLDGAKAPFKLAYMRSLGRQLRRLERVCGRLPHGVARGEVACALCLAGTVIADQSRLQRWALAVLRETLDAQVLPDGGHATRNPAALSALLTAVLPLREALQRRQQAVPQGLVAAIDRMLPMLRFLRHTDGTLSAFHGAGFEPASRITSILAWDDVSGRPSDNARYSGFQRLGAGDSAVLFDTGKTPAPGFAAAAHASALAFELSHGGFRLVGGCGALGNARPGWESAARASAAHSTLTLADRSSAKILALWPLSAILGPVLYRGPREVMVEREGRFARATHDGYRDEFGVVHERTLSLSEDGLWLDGTDKLIGEGKLAAAAFALRFHLGPDVKVRRDKARRNAMLRLPDGSLWLFAVDDGPPLELEESIVLAAPRALKRTVQIVIPANTLTDDVVRWHIARHAEPLSDGDDPGDGAAQTVERP